MGLSLLPLIAASPYVNVAAEFFFNETQKNITSNIAIAKSGVSVVAQGINGAAKFVSLPVYNPIKDSKLYSNKGSSICLGSDAPEGPGSGHSSLGTPASSIDLVTGRLSCVPAAANNGNIYVNDSFAYDATRIYCSQTTDLDKSFDLATGDNPAFESRSGIGMKADGIAMIGRSGIKLVTSPHGDHNSKGGKVRSGTGIELIAKNDDSDIQPLVKGDNLILVLKTMFKRIDVLTDMVMNLAQTNMTLAIGLAAHTHITTIPVIVALPSIDLAPQATLAISDYAGYMIGCTSLKMNLLFDDFNHLTSLGGEYINSDLNRTT